MRPEIESRYYRTFMYQPTDRVPDVEFGYWPQTIRRWLGEGLPKEFESECTKMFSPALDAHLGLDAPEYLRINLRCGIHPGFPEEILEQRPDGSIIRRDASGVIAHRWPNEADGSSIPHFIKFPVECPDDWRALKEHYRLDDPIRQADTENIEKVRARMSTRMITVGATGFYGQLRNWMGMENLSVAFYDYPEMIHDMVEHWSELIAGQIDALPADILIDHISWWEDMASKNGPLVSPRVFREFLQPGYHRVMTAVKKRGCVLGIVDSDGNPHDIVPNWLEEGVNIMFPLEVSAGVDPYAWRREWGMELRVKGAIAKVPLVQGGCAIDRELERVKPLLDQGGCIPHLDHLVPPDISFKNYCEYLEKKRRMIGK